MAIEVVKDLPAKSPIPDDLLGLVTEIAPRFQVDPIKLWKAVKAECFSGAASDEQMFMFLDLIKRYDLNPFMREIFAAVSKGGKLLIGVQVDGWITLAQRHPAFQGYEFEYEKDAKGSIFAITCKVHRKDWKFPGTFRAEMVEWKIDADTWKQRPVHQLHIKAFNNCVRFTLGLTGIHDPDDIERIEKSVVPIHDEPKVETKSVGWINEPPAIETSASNTSPDGGTPVAAAQVDPPVAVAPEPSDNEIRLVTKAVVDAAMQRAEGSRREHLDKLISRHVPAARLNLMLGKLGKANVEALDDEEVAAMITKIERQAK